MVTTRCQSMPHIPPKTASLTKVQQLYRLSRTLFRQRRVPTKPQIDEVLQLMARIPLSELGFDEQTHQPLNKREKAFPFFRERNERVIEYLPVYEGRDFDIGIFCLPMGAMIPLHDHPGMTVLSRLLYGKMHVRAFDVLQRQNGGQGRGWKVQLRDEFVMQDDQAGSYLLPDRANIHMFRALTSCAVLDVLTPPYNPNEQRDCTYYTLTDSRNEWENQDGFLKSAVLKERPVMHAEPCLPPAGFVVRRGIYSGVLPNVNDAT